MDATHEFATRRKRHKSMNTGVLIAIAAVVVIGGGLGMFVYVSRARRDVRDGVGFVANETMQRDADARASESTNDVLVGVGGREVERAARDERLGRPRPIVPFEAASPPPPQTWTAPDIDLIGQTRRQFLNRSIVGMMVLALGTFGLSILGLLWPPQTKGGGSKIIAGKKSDLINTLRATKTPVYNAEGKFYLNEYDPAFVNDAMKQVYRSDVVDGVVATGLIALWQKCPHLGCRVPWCPSSQWFECPCHGSQYNKVGQKRGGPAPRGMDIFPIKMDGEQVIVDVTGGLRAQGVPVGTNTTGQEPEGPHCV